MQTIKLKTMTLCFLLGTACGRKEGSQLDTSIPGSTQVKPEGLGAGYDSERNTWKSKCVEGDHAWVGQNKSTLFLDSNLSFLDLKDRIYGALEVGFENAGLSINGAASYEKASAKTDQSLTVNYLSKMDSKSMVMTNHRPTKLGESYVSKEGKVNPLVRDGCGDEFVNQVDFGGSLAVTVKISFLNEADKEKIAGQAGLKLAILKVSGEIEKLDESIKKNISVNIFATQIGGDSKKLGLIIPADGLFCPGSDLESCTGILKALGYYATVGFPPDELKKVDANPAAVEAEVVKRFPDMVPFHAQFEKDPSEQGAFGWADQLFATKSYKDQAFLMGNKPVMLVPVDDNPVLTITIKKARIHIMTDLDKTISLNQRATDILNSYSLLPAKKSEVRQFLDDSKFNINLLKDQGTVCYAKPEQCLDAETFYEDSKKELDPKVLNLQESDLIPPPPELTGFMAYCVGGIEPSIRDTVDAILGILKTKECPEAEKRLAEVTSFHAPNSGLLSTKVLAQLTNLNFVNLEETGITDADLAELKTLKKITGARLGKNKISNLGFFTAWPNLQWLQVEWNPLDSASSLSGLPKLLVLSVENSGLTSIAPFKNMTGSTWPVTIVAGNNNIKNADVLAEFKQPVSIGLSGNPFKGPCPDHSVEGYGSNCTF